MMPVKNSATPVTWAQVQEASSIFQKDAELVHGPTKRLSPITNYPPKKGVYWITDFAKVTEEAFLAKLQGREVVVLVGCMDKDFAKPLWSEVSKVDWNTLVIPIFVAGGAAQSDDQERLSNLSVLITYICENANVVGIVLSGHTCGCGGLKHMNHFQEPVYTALGDHSDGKLERKFVRDRLEESFSYLVPASHQNLVTMMLVYNRKHMKWHTF